MRHTNNEKLEMIHDGRNRTTKPRKNQNARRTGNLQILRDIGSGQHQAIGHEGKNLKRESQKIEKATRNQIIYCRNLIKGINIWAVSVLFLKWTREQWTREQENSWRLYISRKEGGIGFASIQDNVNASIYRLEDYIKKKALGKIDQKQCKRLNHQQNSNKQKRKMGRKITVWIFQATNKQNLSWLRKGNL